MRIHVFNLWRDEDHWYQIDRIITFASIKLYWMAKPGPRIQFFLTLLNFQLIIRW